MEIRHVRDEDFEALYKIASNTNELKVSSTEQFMAIDEFRWAMANQNGAFLIAHEFDRPIGFVYANAKDVKRPFEHRYACLTYLVVVPEARCRGIATQLYNACEQRLRALGITHVYGWANTEGEKRIVRFLRNRGFVEGHHYVWMDKRL